jgi:NADH-quinone oxidoreductase subunit N
MSSINQLGIILISLSIQSFNSMLNTSLYIIVYCFTTLMFFTLVLVNTFNKTTTDTLSDLNILSTRCGITSLLFTIVILNMAGFPPLLGFFAKLYIVLELIMKTDFESIMIVLYINIITTYYYMKVISNFFFESSDNKGLLSFNIKFSYRSSINFVKTFCLLCITLFIITIAYLDILTSTLCTAIITSIKLL